MGLPGRSAKRSAFVLLAFCLCDLAAAPLNRSFRRRLQDYSEKECDLIRGHGVRMGSGLDEPPKRPIARKTLVRVAKLYRPYSAALITVAVLILISAVLMIATPLLIRQIIDVAIPNSDRSLLAWLSGWMIGLAAVSGALSFVTNYLNLRTGLTVMEDLRLAVYAHLQKLPLSFFTSTRTGDLQTRISSDVASTQLLLTDTLGVLVSNSVIVISAIVAML